ncbi:MAG: iron-containing redox enzyme family protein [Pseudomonas sp.]
MLLQDTRNSYHQAHTPLAGIFSKTRALYEQLLAAPQAKGAHTAARLFLQEHLDIAAEMECELPRQIEALEEWVTARTIKVGEDYAAYLQERQSGKPRRFFSSKAHALHFLRAVAPTKLVDGSWLYGTLAHWQDPRFQPLIQTYLEELGDGVAQMNHVLLYRQLLAKQGCNGPLSLPDEYYVQGTLQLALGHHAEEFLPEVIGYNLGYEQLPLHLLISAFELHELDIDPYYFTLHVTIDNAHSGHARQAVQAVLQQATGNGCSAEFYRRVRKGFQLSELGLSSSSIIKGFNLQEELVRSLEHKSTFGQQVHSDYCKLEGRTVNQWLATPEQMPSFLAALENRGWIKRGRNPTESRFWQLVSGPDALMFGVFTEYEQRLLYEWIADDWLTANEAQGSQGKPSFCPAPGSRKQTSGSNVPPELPDHIEVLQRHWRQMPRAERVRDLIAQMSPSLHDTPEGLLATRLFREAMYQ